VMLSISNELTEWEPSLEIIYNLNSKQKHINDYIKRIERIVDW
jgi:hypothetical protein